MEEKKNGEGKGEKYLEGENIFFGGEGKGGKYLEKENIFLRRRKGRKYLEKGNILFRDVEECISMTFYMIIGIEIAPG